MKKNLLLYILLAFLVVMNGFFLFKHFDTPNQNTPQRPAPRNFISEQLDFDDEQLQKFEALDKEHREIINTLLRDIRSLRDELFDKVAEEDIDNLEIDSISSQIASIEKEKELETFRFFKAVGDICNDDQKARFKTILKDALQRQGPPRSNRPPPRGPRRPGGTGEEGRPPPPRQ